MAEATVVAPPAAAVTTTTEGAQAKEVVDPKAAASAADSDFKTKYELKTKELITQRRRWEAAMKETNTKLAKLPEYEKKLQEFEKTQKNALRNPTAFLQSVYGEGWYEKVIEAKINGVAPAELMAQEMEKMEARFEAKFAEKEGAQTKAQEEAAKKSEEQARRGLFNEAAQFAQTNLKEYPIFEKLGSPQNIAKTIAQRIETEFFKSIQKDEEGNITRQGKILSVKEAADLVESELLDLATSAFSHEKYKPKFSPAKAVVVDPKASKAGATLAKARKTLSNDIGATTQVAKKAPVSDKERRDRAIAAFNANAAKREQ